MPQFQGDILELRSWRTLKKQILILGIFQVLVDAVSIYRCLIKPQRIDVMLSGVKWVDFEFSFQFIRSLWKVLQWSAFTVLFAAFTVLFALFWTEKTWVLLLLDLDWNLVEVSTSLQVQTFSHAKTVSGGIVCFCILDCWKNPGSCSIHWEKRTLRRSYIKDRT